MLVCTIAAYACDNGAGNAASKTDDPGSLSADAIPDTCTPAGGVCLPQANRQACAHFSISELICSLPEDACCLDPFFVACDQGQTFPITASDYHQSCEADADCIGIGEGDGCGCGSICPNAAINVADRANWLADLKNTPASAAMIVCNCPAFFGVSCIDQKCELRRPSLGE